MAHSDNKVRKVEFSLARYIDNDIFFSGTNPTPYCINELARLCNKVEAERKRSPIFGKERGLNTWEDEAVHRLCAR